MQKFAADVDKYKPRVLEQQGKTTWRVHAQNCSASVIGPLAQDKQRSMGMHNRRHDERPSRWAFRKKIGKLSKANPDPLCLSMANMYDDGDEALHAMWLGRKHHSLEGSTMA